MNYHCERRLSFKSNMLHLQAYYENNTKVIFFRNAHLIFAAALSLWLANHSTAAESPPGTSHSVDLLAAFRFSESASVEKTTGICSHREGQHASDKAYRLKEKAVLSVPTATAFPGTDTN